MPNLLLSQVCDSLQRKSALFLEYYKGNPQLITAFPSYESIRESKAMNADPAKLYSEEIGEDYIAVIKNPRYMEAPEYIIRKLVSNSYMIMGCAFSVSIRSMR